MRFFYNTSLLIILLAAAILLAEGCSDSPQSVQKKIDKIALDIQSELPKKLDRDTRLVKVHTRKLELISEYELVNVKTSDGNIGETRTKIEFYLQKKVCPGIRQELLNRGVSSRYIYKGSDGQLIVDLLIKPGDC